MGRAGAALLGGHGPHAILHVNPGRAAAGLQRVEEVVDVPVSGARIPVNEEEIAEAVDGEAGETVAIGVHQAAGGGHVRGQEALTMLQRRGEASVDRLRVPLQVLAVADDAQRDGPIGLVKPPAEAVAVLVEDLDRRARL